MTVIVETGAGVRLANAYAPVAFVTAYLTARNRVTDWSGTTDAVREAAVVAASDYLDKRWGERVRGTRRFAFEEVAAVATITATGVPVVGETITIGDETYTFATALTAGTAGEVLRGADADEAALNLYNAITANAAAAGSTYTARSAANRHVTAAIQGAAITLTATADGASGDFTTLTNSESPGAFTLVAFAGGLDGGSQPLAMPRSGLYDRDGREITGVPLGWKQAMAEYADRARSALLAPDPTVDAQGGSIRRLREKIGPIETETEYVDGSHLGVVLKPYPAADRLVLPYLTSGGGSVR